MQNFAPIALFVYNRPDHARRTLASLQKNLLADESRLFVFSDGARPGQEENVRAVRELVRNAEGFKSVEVIEREYNYGLANSVIDGVSRLTREYGKVIVIEDDVISSPYMLEFFNDGLQRYEKHDKVMHITAFMYPIKTNNLPESFFLRIASSQAWATWDRAWAYFEPDIDKLMSSFTPQTRFQFEVEGAMNFWKHLEEFKAGKNNSWAIRWYASVFLQNGLSLNPAVSMIDNIGHDGSGVHSGVSTIYKVNINQTRVTQFPVELKEDRSALIAVKDFLKHRKGSLMRRGFRYMNNILVRLQKGTLFQKP